eukprot:3256508-Pyramimonas_sp.AAC.1
MSSTKRPDQTNTTNIDGMMKEEGTSSRGSDGGDARSNKHQGQLQEDMHPGKIPIVSRRLSHTCAPDIFACGVRPSK